MHNRTILVFDDDTNILDVFKIVLETSGYHVEVSETSHNILEKVKEVNPDIIIMDNWIPNIGGIKATQLLKSNSAFKHIPVVYCSANNDVALLAEQAGAESYLAKPFDLDDLERTIAEMLPPQT